MKRFVQRALVSVLWGSAAVLVLLSLVLLAAAVALKSSQGTQVLATVLTRWVPGLQLVGVQGALLGEQPLGIERLTWSDSKGHQVQATGLRCDKQRLQWAAHVAWRMVWSADACEVQQLNVGLPKRTKEAGAGAPSLTLPLALSLPKLTVGQLNIMQDGQAMLQSPLAGVSMGLWLQQAQPGDVHRVELHAMTWQNWRINGQASLKASGQVQASVQASSPTDQAEVAVVGPLDKLHVQARVGVRTAAMPAPGKEAAADGTAQWLELEAHLMPWQPWPLASAQVNASGFDLRRVNPQWPQTALTGQLQLTPDPVVKPSAGQAALPHSAVASAPDQLRAEVNLHNDAAGAWDQGRVPVKSLQAQMTLPLPRSPDRTPQWHLLGRQGEGQLAWVPPGRTPKRGKVTASGHWNLDDSKATSIQATLDVLEPRALHTHAPDLQLTGPVSVQGLGEGQWASTGKLTGVDQGRQTGAVPVKATWEAVWRPGQWQVKALELEGGGAQAKGQGTWTQLPEGRWTTQGQLALERFDPAVWLPWPRPSADAAQPTMVNAQMQWQWAMPDSIGVHDLRMEGRCTGTMTESRVLGVPVSGQWTWLATPSRWQMDASLKAAGNALDAQATVPVTSGKVSLKTLQQWLGMNLQAQVHAPALAALQPLIKPWGLDALHGQLDGQIKVNVAGAGQWHTTGHLTAAQVGGRWRDEAAEFKGLKSAWTLQTGRGANWNWQISLEQAQWSEWQLQQWQGELTGTADNHRWSTVARIDLPPRALPSGRVYKESVRAQWAGQGQWAGGASPQWRGQTQTLRLVPLTLDVIPTWLEAQPFQATLTMRDAGWDHWQWQLSPGRVSLLGVDFDVSRAEGRVGDDAFVAVDARMAPLGVAALLQRWQPRAGWSGDLSLAGQLSLSHRAGQPWSMVVDLGRQSGDLYLTDTTVGGAEPQALGLRQIRLTLRADQGVWVASQSFDGALLGRVTATQQVRPADRLAWPAASDALQGQVQAAISDARSLGAWAPAGWRLAGQVQANATLAGTLGAPQFEGKVTGQQLGAQNALLGVYLRDGDLSLLLQGSQATLERLNLKGAGNSDKESGALLLSGRASLSGVPQADLNVVAQRFLLLNRVDRRARLSGQARLQLKGQDQVKIDGKLAFDEGMFDVSRIDVPTVGDDVNVINRPDQLDDTETGNAGAAASVSKRQWYVNLGLDLGQQLRVKGRGLDTRLQGALKFSSPNGRPQLHGAVAAVDGTYVSYGQKLVIERGTLNFSGPVDNPKLDIKAMRAQLPTADSTDVKVGVLITGTAVDPRVRLYSEPPMSETEKLSWLVLGRGPTGLGVADIGLLQTAASALWGGEGASPDDTLVGALGLDELSVRQTDGAVRDTIVTVGKQVSRRWYLGYERSLNAATGTWQAVFRAAQRFTVRLQTGEDNAVDLIWLWRKGSE